MKNPIKNHFQANGYEFLHPGRGLSLLIASEERPKVDKSDAMAQIRDGILEAQGKPSDRIYEDTKVSLKKLGKGLATAFNSIPENQHQLIIESYYSQNNHLKKKHPELFRLIQRLMAFINEVDENKYTNSDNPDNVYKEVKKEREIKKKRGTFKTRTK